MQEIQLDLSYYEDNHTRARNSDPHTSLEASLSAKELARRHGVLIYKTLKDHGPMGKDEISKASGLEPNQVARRMSEIEKAGLVKLTGRTVESKSGRKEREWEAIPVKQEKLYDV